MSPSESPALILASASSRRQSLLRQLGVAFEVRTADVDETPFALESPEDYVLRLARAKAMAVREKHDSQSWILGSDTAVVIDEQILGKPADRAHAQAMLQALSGRTHRVLTGIALCGSTQLSRVSVSQVSFRALSKTEIDAYWETGEPQDKAGAYAIQGFGAVFVEHLSGSYSGVMGLPVFETAELLQIAGIRVWSDASHDAY